MIQSELDRFTWSAGDLDDLAQLSTIGQQYLDLSEGWRDAWRHELRGEHGEWINGYNAQQAASHEPPAKDGPIHLAADGLADPSPESLAIARKMVSTEGVTPAQHELVSRMLGGNLDIIPPLMRDAMARTHKVQVVPQKDLGKGVLGATGLQKDGELGIQITRNVFTHKSDTETADDEIHGFSIWTPGGPDHVSIRHTVTHEFGHAIFELAEIEAGNIRISPDKKNLMAGNSYNADQIQIVDDIMAGLHGPSLSTMKDPTPAESEHYQKAIHALSEYGTTSPDEALAEAYTAYALNGEGADHSTLARQAGKNFLHDAERTFAYTDAGKGMTVNLAGEEYRPYTGCSGLPASREAFEERFGTPEAKAAIARAWGLPSSPQLSMISQQYLELSWKDAWRTELRGPHGEWVRGGTKIAQDAGELQPYWINHRPPNTGTGAPAYDLERAFPDIYDHPEYYGSGGFPGDRQWFADKQSFAAMRAARGKPDALVTVYRGGPKKRMTRINPGDWVTTSRIDAENESGKESGGHVISMRVPARELWNQGDSIHEYGWHPQPEKNEAMRSDNKYVGKTFVHNDSGRTGTVTYADRAGLVVQFPDGSSIMGPRSAFTEAPKNEALSLHKLVRTAANPFVGAELPDTLTHAQQAELSAHIAPFVNAAGSSVPAMISPADHLDYDGKPPSLFNENEPQNAGLLAEIDWNGHLRMSNEVSEDIREALDHPDQPVRVPAALTVPLHEMIHATVPAGQRRATNGDKAAYQDPTMAHPDIEEGFTELGAIQHAREFFDANGLGSREISVPGSPPGSTMDDLAGIASQPEHIRAGTSWGRYKGLTAKAYEWVSLIAQQHTGLPEADPATQAEIVRMSDEVNAVGTAAKPQVMARHVVSDMLTGSPSDQAVLDSTEQSILTGWENQDIGTVVSQARQTARQRLQALEAERLQAERGRA